ncbi:unconventional myosin-XIX isoform X3 [Pongo abelii]|uniref:unconventional myosin-XIX isoform X3 n=1 Tax=Pongo abelii TaxID=9601 RepID=UPI00300622DA
MLQQVNGHNLGSDGQAREYLREDLQEFLGGEVLLYKLDDLTRVNPVTLETVLRCLQARYMADTFYTNAGCTLVALNPFKPVPQLYSPELMREYHAAPQPQKLKPHVFTVGEQTYRNVKSLIEPVNQSIVVSGESGAGKFADTPVQSVGVQFLHGCKPMCRVSWPPLQPLLERLLHPPSLQGGPYAPSLSLIRQPLATQTASQSLWSALFQNDLGMGILLW